MVHQCAARSGLLITLGVGLGVAVGASVGDGLAEGRAVNSCWTRSTGTPPIKYRVSPTAKRYDLLSGGPSWEAMTCLPRTVVSTNWRFSELLNWIGKLASREAS